MIDAYLDESGIHEGSKICVIAGYFGGPGQMKRLETAWKKTLVDFNFPIGEFHAKDLIKSSKHHPMLKGLARIVGEQRKVYPVTWAVFVDDFNSFSLQQRRFITGATLSPKGKLITSGCPNKPYFVPFQNIIKVVTDATPVGGKAHFSFGVNTQFAEYAVALFRQIIDNPPPENSPIATWKSRDRLGTPNFPSAMDTAPLQAADLLVHTTYLMLNDWRNSKKIGQSAPHVYEILDLSLGNMRSKADHVYQDKVLLRKLIDQAKSIVPHWRDS